MWFLKSHYGTIVLCLGISGVAFLVASPLAWGLTQDSQITLWAGVGAAALAAVGAVVAMTVGKLAAVIFHVMGAVMLGLFIAGGSCRDALEPAPAMEPPAQSQSLQDTTRDAEVGETLRAQLPALTPVALTSPVPEIAQERQRRERYADCLLDGMAGALERPKADRWATAPWMSETTISDDWFTDWVPWVAPVARECAGVWADAPRMSAMEHAVLEIGRATELMVWIGLADPRLEVACEYWATWRTTVPDGMLLEAHEERGPDAARAYREAAAATAERLDARCRPLR